VGRKIVLWGDYLLNIGAMAKADMREFGNAEAV
jgi:hypothetical protein